MLNCDDIMMLKIITVYFCLYYTMLNTEIQSAATRHVAIPGHLIFTTYPTHSIALTLKHCVYQVPILTLVSTNMVKATIILRTD